MILPESIPVEILQKISAEQAWYYKVLPLTIVEGKLNVISSRLEIKDLSEDLAFITGMDISVTQVDSELLDVLLVKYYRKKQQQDTDNPTPGSSTNVDLGKHFDLDSLLSDAQKNDASDVHFEPYEHRCRIRYRIDGVLIERFVIPGDEYPALVNKVKIRANLDIAEKRLPQDGRIFMNAHGLKFDVRVSTLPTLHGEKIVMRLLKGSETRLDIRDLGFTQEDLTQFMEGVSRPNGMVLVSGPTGSGKSTTLYATLQHLNDKECNILTIEDPIEYTLEGVNQVQLKEIIGLDFSSALRTFLRQDPDIIMVGEIRDVNTANMAIRASLTGHLVLSTIHTNSAWGIVARLIDMGVPSYLLADTLNTAVAQRLVRRLCPYCKKKQLFHPALLPRPEILNTPFPEYHFEAQGCESCFFTGYKGRQAVYEVIPIDKKLSEMIRSVQLDILPELRERKIASLSDNAMRFVADGSTSLKEIYPILNSSI